MTLSHQRTDHIDPVGQEPGTSAGDVTSLPVALATFSRYGSPRLLVTAATIAVVARLALGFGFGVGWSRWDPVALVVVATMVPLVEWFVHRLILHAPAKRLGSLVIDPGAGHRSHHLDPSSIPNALLRPVDAALFTVTNAVLAVVIVWPLLTVVGAAHRFGPVVTAVAAALVALTHYEWAHFLFHTAYRPKSSRYRRLKSNHRLHHWRNEGYWLGVTSNGGDRLARTLPKTKSDVSASPTARTLGVDPAEDAPSR